MTAVLFLILIVLLFASVPIFVALSGTVAIIFALFNDLDLVIIIQRLFAGINKFSLMSIPLFVLAANVMSEGGISKRIVRISNAFVGRIPGGLGMTTILSCLFFGAISGSAPATVVAIGAILYPALKERGYGKHYSTGVIAASGALGVIIPPSVTMIVYGTVTGASVGTLFVAGFGAGIIFALVFMAYTFIYAKKHPKLIIEEKTTWREKFTALKSGIWGLGVPIIVLGGIYGGVFTPTEAAAVAAVYAILVALMIYRELDIKGLIQCIIDSAITTVQVMILLAAASVFAWILTSEGITVAISQAIISLSSNKYIILLLMNVVLLIAGMFLDGASIITIIGPLFFPIAMAVGIDPIHLGIVMIVNTAIGMYTPPFGLNLFVTPSITKQSITTVSKGVLPFILISLISLLLITYIPQISLWLPQQIYGVW